MKKISLIFFILFVLTVSAQADSIYVADVKRNIPLSDDEPVYRDYILSGDAVTSLKKNLVVFVKRSLNVKNSDAKEIGELETAVGQVRVIHVDKKVAIAREYALVSRDEEAVLDQTGIMTGDRIDLSGSFVDSKPMKKKDREPNSDNSEKNSSLEKSVTLFTAPGAAKPIPLPEI